MAGTGPALGEGIGPLDHDADAYLAEVDGGAVPDVRVRVWARDDAGRPLDPVRLVNPPWPLIVDVTGLGFVAVFRREGTWHARRIAYDTVPAPGALDGSPRRIAASGGRLEVDVLDGGRVVLVIDGAVRG